MKMKRKDKKKNTVMKLFNLFNKYLLCAYYVVIGAFLVLGIEWGKKSNKKKIRSLFVRDSLVIKTNKEINDIFQVVKSAMNKEHKIL